MDVRTKNGQLMGTDVFYGFEYDPQIKKLYLFNTIITGSYRKLNGEDYITNNESAKFSIHLARIMNPGWITRPLKVAQTNPGLVAMFLILTLYIMIRQIWIIH